MNRIKANLIEILSWLAIFAFLALVIWVALSDDPEARNVGLFCCFAGGALVVCTAARK